MVFKKYKTFDEKINIKEIIWKTIISTCVAAILMFLFESLKQTIFPSITIWGSHAITIILVTIISSLFSYFYFLSSSVKDLYEKINHELSVAKEKAEESNSLKSAFLSNMSHEIRTPMNGILGFTEILKNPNLTSDQQHECIEIIQKSGDRMLNIINDIIDISKIESGQMSMLIKEIKIDEQLDYIYSFFKPDVEAKGIKLSLKKDLLLTNAIIETDGEKVFAILTNLVKNAVKFTKQGSIEFGYKVKGSFIEYYVKDTGIGIPKDRQAAIFERFVQADIHDTRAFQGAGLGLAISDAYVAMLGGKIWVESKEGKGSIFYFTIPYKIKNNEVYIPDDLVSHNLTKAQKGNLKILIVEDNDISQLVILKMIESYSKEILIAGDGIEAIELCHNNPDLDLVLMDIKIPIVNGHDATKKIREFNKDIIIIAQTAYGLADDREKALESGCNDYISKPIKQDLLLALIQKYFKQSNNRLNIHPIINYTKN